MSYQLYRNTTLGHTLQESLDEFVQCGQISQQIALKVLLQFDKCINVGLANRVKTRLTFKVGALGWLPLAARDHSYWARPGQDLA